MISRTKSFVSRLLPKNKFARGVSVLVGGTAGAQLLLVLASPLLTRLYSPEDFGLLAVYASLLALIGVISSLRYELAIPLPEDDQEAANVAVLCLILVTSFSLLTGLLLIFFGTSLAETLGTPKLKNYLWLLPIGVFISGVYSVFNYWGIRTKNFGTIAATKLRQAFATIIIQLMAFKLGGIALLFGQVAGQGVGTTSLAIPAIKRPEFKKINFLGIKKATIRYQDFPKFSTWAGLVNTAGHQLPPLIFAAFFSVSAAGLYALAHRILSLPASLIGQAVGNVFLSEAAVAHRENRLDKLYLKLQDTLIQIGLPPTLIIVIAGSDIFALVFGEEWRQAGSIAQWLAIGAFAGFVVSPLSQIFTILEKQKTGLTLQITLFTLRFTAIFIGILKENLLLAVALYSLASLLGYMLYLIAGVFYTKSSFKKFATNLLKNLSISLIIMMPLLISKILANSLFFYTTFLVTCLITVSYVIVITRKHFTNHLIKSKHSDDS